MSSGTKMNFVGASKVFFLLGVSAASALQTVAREPYKDTTENLVRFVRDSERGHAEDCKMKNAFRYDAPTQKSSPAKTEEDRKAEEWQARQVAEWKHREERRCEAEELQRSALTIRERGLGPGHPSVADSLNNLAALLTVKGAFQEVIPLHRRALQIREKTFGRDHARVADTLHNLGTVHTEIGEYEKAEEFYNAAIAIKEKALPPNHPELADTLNNFANLAFLRKEYSTAIEFARKAAKSGHPKRGAYLAALHAQKNSDGTIAESFEWFR